jgi:hypothetical protein
MEAKSKTSWWSPLTFGYFGASGTDTQPRPSTAIQKYGAASSVTPTRPDNFLNGMGLNEVLPSPIDAEIEYAFIFAFKLLANNV